MGSDPLGVRPVSCGDDHLVASNPRLKLIRRLESRRQRAKLGLFVCEGEDLVDAALAAGIEPADLLVAGEDVEPELLAAVSTLAHPSRVVGVFRSGRPAPLGDAAGRRSRSGTSPTRATWER